jgi:ParB/RepB/Spo0J family partition protein
MTIESIESIETTEPTNEADAPVKRSRGRQSGPSLKVLLTQKYPDGATTAELVVAGYTGDFSAALKRQDVKQLEDGRYIWIGNSERTIGSEHAAERGESAHHFVDIEIAKIHVGVRRRELHPDTVRALSQSLKEIGLQTAITVTRCQDGFELIIGHHRLEAAKLLGWTTILCMVVSIDDLTRQLWEIDENLCRAELTELELGEHLAARKEIYEHLRPQTQQHVAGALAANEAMGRGDATANLAAASFTTDTAARTGMSERAIQRSIHRAEHIAPEIKDEIRGTPIADNGVELDALASATPEKQAVAVEAVKSGEAPNVRDALASLDETGKTAKTSRPTSRVASNTDKRLDRIIAKVKLLSANDRETLWDILADRWQDEMSAVLSRRLPDIGTYD